MPSETKSTKSEECYNSETMLCKKCGTATPYSVETQGDWTCPNCGNVFTVTGTNLGKKIKEPRQSWDQYFLSFCELASTRSMCLRRIVGAILVKNNQILATGYNGPPKGIPHCIPEPISCDCYKCLGSGIAVDNSDPPKAERCDVCGGIGNIPMNNPVCIRMQKNIPSGQNHEMCWGLHAEQNAIIQAAYHGTNISGSILYCTTYPCSICAKMIINAGIKKIIYMEGYPDEMSDKLFTLSKITLDKVKKL